MPVNKNMLERLIIIDRCLKRHTPRYTSKKLQEVVSEELTPVHLKTIQNDIVYIRKFYPDLPVRGPYNYPDPDFSLLKAMGEDPDTQEFKDLIAVYQAYILSQEFHFLPAMQDVWREFSQLEEVMELNGLPIGRYIQLDFNRQTKGLEYIPTVMEAITDRKILGIQYQSYQKEAIDHFDLEPYFIKEYNNRWYIIGFDLNKYYKMVNVALDRILKMDISIKTFEPKRIDIEEYFDEVVGVTKMEGQQVEEVVLSVEPLSARYMLSKPLHKSQEGRGIRDGRHIIALQVKQNRELINQLLAYGSGITVLQPEGLRQLMKEEISRMLEQY